MTFHGHVRAGTLGALLRPLGSGQQHDLVGAVPPELIDESGQQRLLVHR
jgi:hypothetical protein